MTSNTNKRFEGTLKVDPNCMGKLIGAGGCNIRRITSEVRAGCYIRGNGDTFKISAWTKQAVHKAASMLKADQTALKDPTKRPSKPFAIFKIDDQIVPHIVGRGGDGLRAIMTKVGDGCYIVHRDGAFHISANSTAQLTFAKRLILQQKNCFLEWRDASKNDDDVQSHTSGKFDALALSSDEEEEDNEYYDPDWLAQDLPSPNLLKQQLFDYNGAGSIHRKKTINHVAKKVARAADIHISQVDKTLIDSRLSHSDSLNTQKVLPKLTDATFPTLPGTPSEGNVKLEITGKLWKPTLASQEAPVKDSFQVQQARKLRRKKLMEDEYTKYMSLYQTTQANANLATGDTRKILTDKAHSYKIEAQRLHKIINPSWADMADDSDSDDDDHSLGNL